MKTHLKTDSIKKDPIKKDSKICNYDTESNFHTWKEKKTLNLMILRCKIISILHNTTTVFLKGELYIIHEGWYTIKQRK